MTRFFVFFAAVCFGCSRAPKLPDMVNDMDPPERPLRLSLEVVAETVKVGEVPKFKLTIRNEGDRPERIIDLSAGRRADLQDTYYDLELRRDGRILVDIPRMISDPGPVRENDFFVLMPHETVTFELTRFAVGLQFLTTGKYQAQVRFWQDPYQSWESAFFSPPAEFTIGN